MDAGTLRKFIKLLEIRQERKLYHDTKAKTRTAAHRRHAVV
jgi:hypothetical protein